MLRLGTFFSLTLTLSIISCTDMGSWDLIAERFGAVAPVQGPSTRRVLVTATGVTSTDLTDFPLLVKLPPSFPYGECDPDGLDLRFYASDGVTPLAFERESWNPVGESIFWIKIPVLTNPTAFYIYFGSADAVDGSYAPAVWTNGYVGVWHGIVSYDSNGDPTGFRDSTGRGDGSYMVSSYSRPTIANPGDGGLGDVFEFTASDEVLYIPDSSRLAGLSRCSVEMMIKNTGSSSGRSLLSSPYLSMTVGGSENFIFEIPFTVTSVSVTSPSVLASGSWKSMSISWDGAQYDIYSDIAHVLGDSTALGSGILDPYSPGTALCFGNSNASAASCISAFLDEIRISTAARDSVWMLAQHRSLEGSAVTFGSAEDVP